jgi:hypothetical protein
MVHIPSCPMKFLACQVPTEDVGMGVDSAPLQRLTSPTIVNITAHQHYRHAYIGNTVENSSRAISLESFHYLFLQK